MFDCSHGSVVLWDDTPAYGARFSRLLAALALDYFSALLRLSATQVLGRSSSLGTRALSHSAALPPYRLLLRLACPALCRVEISGRLATLVLSSAYSSVVPALSNSGARLLLRSTTVALGQSITPTRLLVLPFSDLPCFRVYLLACVCFGSTITHSSLGCSGTHFLPAPALGHFGAWPGQRSATSGTRQLRRLSCAALGHSGARLYWNSLWRSMLRSAVLAFSSH